jgi:hypothetical protein
MTRVMANWEVESDIILPKGTPFARYDHPGGAYTVFIRPSHVDGAAGSALTLQIIFDAPDLKEASDLSQDLTNEFLDHLTYTSNMRARLGRLQHIFDWEPAAAGSTMRRALYFHTASGEDAPYEALEPSILDTIKILQSKPVSPRLRRTLKWFANGVASQYQDDQFAFFWFVVELIAQIIKNVTPVPDRCPQCHGPLYCPACNATHMHRPFPKQAVEQVFRRYVKDGADEFFKEAMRARNMLLHGDEVHSIEAELGIEFHKLVDSMGHLAWAAIFDQFVPAMAGTKPSFLTKNIYVGMNIHFHADVQVGFTPDFDNPDPTTFPKIQLSMEYMDASIPGAPQKPTKS